MPLMPGKPGKGSLPGGPNADSACQSVPAELLGDSSIVRTSTGRASRPTWRWSPMSRQLSVLAIGAAGLCLLAGVWNLSPRPFKPLPLGVNSQPVDFVELRAMAARASAAYESADAIRQSYPKTILVNSPGTMDVQYFLEQDNGANTQHVTIRGTANRENFLEDIEFTVHETAGASIPVAVGFDRVARRILADVTARLNNQHK